MTRTFHPIRTIVVPASHPHLPGTEYHVSKGFDNFIEGSPIVTKVQIARNGSVLGNVVPSFPSGSDDIKRVQDAMDELGKSYVEEKAFRAQVIEMARNLGHAIDLQSMYNICGIIAKDPRLYDLIEDCITEYYVEGGDNNGH
jgi:hypothetical protein